MEVSLHHLCAPDHQPIQGRQFDLDDWERINGGLKRPIGTLNCGHHISYIIRAAARPAYTEEERQAAIDSSNEEVEYNGEKMTRYEASQRMRAKERKIRAMRSEENALKAAGDTSGAAAVKRDIRRRTAEYKKFCSDVGLEERMDKTYDFGFVPKKRVDFPGESGIIEAYKSNTISVKITDNLSSEVVERVHNSIKNIANDFPILRETIDSINFGDIDDALGINKYLPSTGRNCITLSANAFSDISNLTQILLNDFKTGRSYETTSFESLVAHETGHAAHISLALKRADLRYGKPLSVIELHIFEQEYNKIMQEIYNAAFSDESLFEIFEKCEKELGST